MFKEGCPNTNYLSDEMFNGKFLSLEYDLYNSLIDK